MQPIIIFKKKVQAGLFLGLFFVVGSGLSNAQDPRALAILEKARQHLSLIHALEFSYEVSQRDDGGKWAIDSGKMIFLNGMWYSEGVVGSELFVSAFNGLRFQMIETEGDQRTLILSNQSTIPNPSMHLPPIIEPFSFAVDRERPYTLSRLRDPKNWDRVGKITRYLKSEEFNGQACDVLEISETIQGTKANWHVWFASELNYYPLRIMLFDISGEQTPIESKVSNFYRMSIDGESLVIPIVGKHIVPTDTGVWERIVSINESSIKINHEIDEDIFTLPASMADYIRDVDAGSFVRTGMAPIKKFESDVLANEGHFPRVIWIGLGFIFFVFCGCVLWRLCRWQ